MLLSHLTNTSDRQKIWMAVLAIFVVTAMFATPFTLFQYFDMQYRAQHNDELQYISSQWTVPEDQSVVTNYGYRDTPWMLPAKVFSSLFVIVPALVTIFLSALYLVSTQGTLKSRFSQATFLATAIIPIWYLCELPWGIIYWDGYEWPLGAVINLILGSLVVLAAVMVNGIIVLILKKRFSKI